MRVYVTNLWVSAKKIMADTHFVYKNASMF